MVIQISHFRGFAFAELMKALPRTVKFKKKTFIGYREATCSQPNKYSTDETPKTRLFCGKHLSEDARGFIRASLAENSWKKHNSAWQCFLKFCEAKSLKITWPIPDSTICDFAAWSVKHNSLQPSTVKSYVYSLSTIHELKGFENYPCMSPLVKRVISGAQNLKFYDEISKCTRKVMSLPLLKLIGHEIARASWDKNSKQVIWTACVVAFCGSFRLSEILSKNEWSFNKTETLLWSDVKFTGPNSVLIHVQVEKTRNVKGAYIDLFEFDGHGCCPVKSLKNLANMSHLAIQSDKPVFSFKSGKLLTAESLLRCVRELLRPHIGIEVEGVQGHSFRAGLPAAMADCPNLANNEEVKSWGRWNSDSFLLYTRLQFQVRRAIFDKIMSMYK